MSKTNDPRFSVGGIDLRQLRSALVSAEFRSFAKAADHLGLSKVTLRGHIAYLESRFGTLFFTRSPRGVTLTGAGFVFIEGARRVIGEVEGLYEKTRAVAQGTAGTLGIGFTTSISAGNLRSSLLAFGDEFSGVRLRYVEDERQTLLCKLDTGSLDFLIISGSIGFPDTERLGLWSERMLVALPAAHPLANRDLIHWTELQGETFLAPRTTADDIVSMVQTRLSRPGRPPMVEITDLSREAVLSMVGAQRGITLVSAGSAGYRVDNVVFRELHDVTGPHNLNFSAYWRSDNRNPALRTFIDFLRIRYSLALPEA